MTNLGTFKMQCTMIFLIALCIAKVDSYEKRSVSNGIGFVIGDKDTCHKKAKGNSSCQSLQFPTCFGVKLPYTMTSSELVNENFTQQQLQNEMSRWEGLKSSPKCWAVIQPLLCSYYFPKCQDGLTDLPPQALCKVARNPCRIIEQATKQWPEFLHCHDLEKFPTNCKNEIGDARLNFTAGKCMDPMKEVENPSHYYEGFDGCALKCQDPLYTSEEHESVSSLIWYVGCTALFCTGWVFVTFTLEWYSSSQFPQYPSAIVYYVNFWYFLAIFGWLFQYLPYGKEDVVCRKDGTVRQNEPGTTESIFCTLVFTWIYSSIMSVLCWLMVFAYVWNLTCNAVGRMRERVDKQRLYFNVFAFCTPLLLTIICCSVGKVDGSSIYGICFVGYSDPTARVFLVLVPVGLSLGVILFYLWGGTYRLLSVSLSSSDFISPEGRAEIKSNGIRMLLFSAAASIIVVVAMYFQINSITNQPLLEKSLRESIMCKLNFTDMAECGASEKPNLNVVRGNIVVFFLGGLIVSLWGWTSSSVNIWRRSIRRICKSENSEGHHPNMPKHKLISKAFAKRHELPRKGRLSLSLCSTHEDPIGLNKLLDPNHLCRNAADLEQSQQFSQTNGDGQEISSDWAASIPHFVARRGALVPPHSSNSVSCVSEDSRRPSCDSAMSEQMAAKHFQGSNPVLDYRGNRSKKEFYQMGRRRSGRFWPYWRFKRNSNRGSSSSLESNPGSLILPAITALMDKRQNAGDDNLVTIVPNNQSSRKPIILRELAIQTSIEKLYSPTKCVKQCNLSNNLSVDKATQSSLVSLHEIGTQTKKSATKKKDKNKDKSHKEANDVRDQATSSRVEAEDPVLKLLQPN